VPSAFPSRRGGAARVRRTSRTSSPPGGSQTHASEPVAVEVLGLLTADESVDSRRR
jgi:hypothetical protein